MCSECWGEYLASVKSDEIEDLNEQLAEAKVEITECQIELKIAMDSLRRLNDCDFDDDHNEKTNASNQAWVSANRIEQLLAKYKGE